MKTKFKSLDSYNKHPQEKNKLPNTQSIIFGMTKQKLQVFARIRPFSHSSKGLPLTVHSNRAILLETNRAKLSSTKQQQQYGFNYVFEQQSTQEQVFNELARPVIDNCLQGYNGTIFAYGQTGSGKTFTMSGGDLWQQRGIIPRVLSYLFLQFQKSRHQTRYSLTVSYIQIYNQNAYDLLSQQNSDNTFQQWPKITFMQDQDKNFSLRNGSLYQCKTEQQALDYFMMGNFLRKVSCTSMNQASSRSHSIFVLNIRGIDLHSQTEIYSKINLVDLAGSERVSKSHAEGIVLTEAKSINLSLSYLEQVIVSLNQKAKGKVKAHIPYRNSLLTTFLKDSLGGNCKTAMIATIAGQLDNLDETISTLRFSQRVRQIKNQLSKNQKTPIQTKLQMLQRENLLLKKKLQSLSQNQSQQFKRTDSEEIRSAIKLNDKQVSTKVQDFMNQRINSIQIQHIDHANIYFKKMKELYKNKMKEYVNQLTFISKKILNYEEMLDQREKKHSQNPRY